MGETDFHVREIASLIFLLQDFFAAATTGNNMFYYEKGVPEKCCSRDAYVGRRERKARAENCG
jgi:hypothetical protein